MEKKQIRKLQVLKRKRNQKKVAVALNELRKAAETNVNLMPFIFGAVKDYATLGEVCGTLREVFGEYRPPSIF